MAGDEDPTPVLDPRAMRALRRLRDISQTKIAHAIGRSQFYVASIERGTVTPTAREIQIIVAMLSPLRRPQGGL